MGTTRSRRPAARAMRLGAARLRTVQHILASGVDRVPLGEDRGASPPLPVHPNIRGSAYYTREESLCSLTPPVDKLSALRLPAFAEALQRQARQP